MKLPNKEKWTCDTCGFVVELDKASNPSPCPICKGRLVSPEELKLREEAQDALEHEGPDADTSPEQDAIEEIQDQIKSCGNDNVWNYIEEINVPEARAHERGLFLRAGGRPPEGMPLSI